jgi:ribonuclease R
VFLDEAGVPVDVRRAERWESHRLVEDLMLLANETIGARATRENYPFMYRIHEPPDALRMAHLANIARALGFQPSFSGRPSPGELQALLLQKPGKPVAQLLASLALRSMKQARYSEADRGHYGLATQNYTHFTSPIRRYPDLTVHRMIETLARGKRPADNLERMVLLGDHCSDREQRAANAERDLVKVKLLMYLAKRLGEQMDAVITGVEEFGLFAQGVELPAEGLIHVDTLGDDFYRFDRDSHSLAGYRSGNRYRLGDVIRVQVAHVNIDRRELDFRIVKRIGHAGAPRRKQVERPRGRGARQRTDGRPLEKRGSQRGKGKGRRRR